MIKKTYKNKATLLFTDTDSLCYIIETDDFYKDMYANKGMYDLSNFPKDSEFYDESNKKVLGKFKDEIMDIDANVDKIPASEFVGIRPKMYSIKGGSFEKKVGKGRALLDEPAAGGPAAARDLRRHPPAPAPDEHDDDEQGGALLL